MTDTKFFKQVYEASPKICAECGIECTPYKAVFMAHICAKSCHPILRHDPENIVVLCFTHHRQYDQGNKKAMKIWKELEERKQYLIQKEYDKSSI